MNSRFHYAATERASHQDDLFDNLPEARCVFCGHPPHPDSAGHSFLPDKVTRERFERDICRIRHRDNPQSKAAFKKIKDRLTEAQERVLRVIRNSDNGMTCDEISIVLGVTPNEVSGRCSELKRDGKVVECGRRLTRKGRCTAAVLKAI